MPLTPAHPSIPLTDWPHRTPLVAAWLQDAPALRDLAPPRPHARPDVLGARLKHAATLPRQALADALRAGNQALDAPDQALRAIDLLERDGTLAVVTGQQPGLLLGPLYTPYKVMSAIALARRLSGELDRPVVPIFWAASEDHDFQETGTVLMHGADGAPVRYRAPEPDGPRQLADLDARSCPLDALHAWWETHCAKTEFRHDVWEMIARTHAASRSMADWSIRLLLHCLPPDAGLVVIDPTWPAVRALAAPLIAREIDAPLENSAHVTRAGQALQAAGFEPPMHKASDRCAFFLLRDGLRLPVHFDGARFHVDGASYTAQALHDLLRATPERFSAAASLRPVIQDALLPNIGSVLGPGEVGYLSQLGDVYAQHGVPRPPGYTRFSATLIEPPAARFLARHGLHPQALFDEPEALRKQLARQSLAQAIGEPLAQLAQRVEAVYDGISPRALEIDPTLEMPLAKQRARVLDLLGKSGDLVARRAAQQDETLTRQLETARHAVAPLGSPQERVYSLLSFLNRHGPGLSAQLLEYILEADLERHHYLGL